MAGTKKVNVKPRLLNITYKAKVSSIKCFEDYMLFQLYLNGSILMKFSFVFGVRGPCIHGVYTLVQKLSLKYSGVTKLMHFSCQHTTMSLQRKIHYKLKIVTWGKC